MNAFFEHHKDSISMHYACFDRILVDGRIRCFMDPGMCVAFFSQDRKTFPVYKENLTKIAAGYDNWVMEEVKRHEIRLIVNPEGRRDELMEPLFAGAPDDTVVGIIKAREPARILTSVGTKGKSTHLEHKLRWINQYNFYIQDRAFGPMFIRICPYFPFPVRLCLNQHDWIARRLRAQGVRVEQRGNAFLHCDDEGALQQIADSLTGEDLRECGRKWAQRLVPYFSEQERQSLNCDHTFYFKQVEYCDNLIFGDRQLLNALHDRLLDANRKLGSPDQVAVVFGTRINKQHNGRLQTSLEDLHLGQPVLRALYKHSVLKNYVRGGSVEFGGHDRMEIGTNDVTDFRGMRKGVENLTALRERLSQSLNNARNAQQDILQTFLDRGELQQLSEPTVIGKKRIPGLKLYNPRQLALMHALVEFSRLVAGEFTTPELYPRVLAALGLKPDDYKLGSLRYDLAKLRAKNLVVKVEHSRRYRLTATGYRLCVIYLKLFHRLYAPLTAGAIHPYDGDPDLPAERLSTLDRLYIGVKAALDVLVAEIGLDVAA